jgi:YesN/AraC family two-component response regulator
MVKELKLLIVDDEPMARRRIRSFNLASQGYSIIGEAENGEQAWRMVVELAPDIVVADIGMPLLNGLDLLKRIHNVPNPPKVILLTCYEDFEKIQQALRYGAFDYLTKLLLSEVEFLACLTKAADEIHKERKQSQKMINQLLLELLLSPDEHSNSMDQLMDSSFVCKQYQLALIRYEPTVSVYYSLLVDCCARSEGPYTSLFMRIESGLWGILFVSSEANSYASFFSWVSGILLLVKDVWSGVEEKPVLVIGQTKYDLLQLPQAYKECRMLLDEADEETEIEKKSEHLLPVPAGTGETIENGTFSPSIRSEIRDALRFIADKYTEEIDLPITAQHVNLSPSWFGTLFRNEVGRSFFDYLQEYRLEKAKILLRQSDYKIYEIASMIGIPNPRYFSRLFVERYTVSPLDYRKKKAE